MKKLYQFNKLIYKGNVDRDFFLFCCKKEKKLYVYILLHILYSLLSLFSLKAEISKKKNYHKYLKKVKNIALIVEEFRETHQRKIDPWYLNEYSPSNTIITTTPELIVKPFLTKEHVIAPKLNQEYEIDFTSYTNENNDNYNEAYYSSFKNVNLVESKNIFM